jgi:hypothetical protein
MSFSENVVNEAWERADEQCECNRRTHKHFRTPCGKPLVKSKRGKEEAGGWEANHYTPSGGDDLSNCEILCWDCYENSQQRSGPGIESGIQFS